MSKVTRPLLAGIVSRKRLFRLMDQGLKGPVFWVAGPAGSGKTSLVSSYIEARRRPCLWYNVDRRDKDAAAFFRSMEFAARQSLAQKRVTLPAMPSGNRLDLPAFARRYFENLYGLLAPGTILVFDNFDAAFPFETTPSDSSFHDVIREGLILLPGGMNAVLIAKGVPPPSYAPLRAPNPGGLIGWSDLRMTLEETRDLVRIRGRRKVMPESARPLWVRSDGWVTGLVILMEKASPLDIEPQKLSRHRTEEIFEYFAGELFERRDKEVRSFLMATSFLPEMTASMAEALTENSRAGQILEDLYQHGHFTEKHPDEEPVFRYHGLFREFLVHRAERESSPGILSRIRIRAAAILEETGRVEEAAGLLRDTEDREGLVRLVRTHARSLVDRGRTKALEELLLGLPEEIRESDPWLLYWRGVCSLPADPAAGRLCFEKAFGIFEASGEDEGALLSWAGFVDSALDWWDAPVPLDRWIAWLEGRMARGLSFPSPDVEAHLATGMARALAFFRPEHPDVAAWLERAMALIEAVSAPEVAIKACMATSAYHIWMGDRIQSTIALEQVRSCMASARYPPTCACYVAGKWLEAANILWTAGDKERARQCLSEGLAAAREGGWQRWDSILHCLGATLSLLAGDLSGSVAFIQKLGEKPGRPDLMASCGYHRLYAWHHLLQGDANLALGHATKALAIAEESKAVFPETLCRLAVANIIIHLGEDLSEASSQLVRAWELIRRSGSHIFAFIGHMTEARLALFQGEEQAARAALEAGMGLGRQQGYVNAFWWWEPAVMTRLCARSLEWGIEPEYVRNLIVRNGLSPEVPPMEIEQWPWPLKIYTLGRFDIVRDGEPVRFHGKAQQKPLLLLKALITLGGRNVPEGQLNDVLWPEADGDLAHQSFTTTLRRLRHLLGDEKAVLLRDGRLTLNNRCCWVDAWAFERLLGQAEKEWSEGLRGQKGVRLFEQAMNFYKGPFLSGEGFSPALHSVRERMRSKFLRCAEAASRACAEAGDLKKAAGFCLKGLEIDNLAEDFYRILITCYRDMEMHGDALAAYERCRKTLAAAMGLGPSPAIRALVRSLKPA